MGIHRRRMKSNENSYSYVFKKEVLEGIGNKLVVNTIIYDDEILFD